MILERNASKRGAFGSLWDDSKQKIICHTLERAYPAFHHGDYSVKIPDGEYVCVRGIHRLLMAPPNHGLVNFETFEVTGVLGHTGILFHVGNTHSESHGCILVGKKAKDYRLWDSREAFNEFMNSLTGVNSFKLTVKRL